MGEARCPRCLELEDEVRDLQQRLAAPSLLTSPAQLACPVQRPTSVEQCTSSMDLVERGPHLDQLASLLGEVEAGRGRLVLLAGEAGVGKSALVRRFSQAVGDRARVVLGACDPLSTPPPLGPLLDVAHVLGDPLAALLAGGSPRQQVFSATLATLDASPRPTVAIVEDVHWADEATLDLLRYLGRRVASRRILLVCTYRDDELGPRHPLRVVLGDLATAEGVRRMAVLPLSESAVAELASGSGIDPRELYRTTGGNPFFVTEVLASGAVGVPQTVRDAVLARVARLPAEARAVLEAAAAIGARVEPRLLATVWPLATDAALEGCLAAGVLHADGQQLTFRHELARSVIEDAVTPHRRATLHHAVLRALRASGNQLDEWARLAHHAEAAGDRAAVLEFAPLAAERAARLRAHREAAAQYARALRFADGLAPEARARLLEAYAYECYLTEEIDAAIEARRAALAIWRAAGERVKEGETQRWLSRLYWFAGRNAEANAAAQAALEVLEALAPGPQLAWAYSNVAQLCMLALDARGARVWGERALVLAEQLGEREVVAHALNNVGAARAEAGDLGGFVQLERSLAVALDADLEEHAARAYSNLCGTSIRQYELETAERYVRAGMAYATEHDLGSTLLYLEGWLARLLLLRGQWTAAADLAAGLLRRVPLLAVPRNALLVLGCVRLRRGDPEAWSVLDHALAAARPTGELARLGPLYAARAEAAWLAGRSDVAREEARAGYALAEAVGHPWLLSELGFWRWRVGDLEALPPVACGAFALQVGGRWAEAAAEWRSRGCPYHAALALLDGDEAALREALLIFEQLGAGPALAVASRRIREAGWHGPRPSTRAHPIGLTVRESEVLELLAQGLRNAEIAERLTLSTRTVDHHVSAVLAKLGARSRTEASQAARKHGLLGSESRRATER